MTLQGTCGWVLTGGNEQSTNVWGSKPTDRGEGDHTAAVSQHSCDLGDGPAVAQGGLQISQDLFQLCFPQSLKLLQGTKVQSSIHEWKVQLSQNDSIVHLNLDPHRHGP